MTNNKLQTPTPPTARLEILDVLRGFAILGILIMNMPSYTGAFYNGNTWSTLDQFIMQIMRFFFQAKFFSLFSFLFGLGIAIQLQKAHQQGHKFTPFYTKRLFFLLLIGLAHALLLWWGDILISYTLLGFLLIPFFHRSPKTVLLVAAVCISIAILSTAPGPIEDLRNSYWQNFSTLRQSVNSGQAIYATGTFTAIVSQNFKATLLRLPNLLFSGWTIFAMFLLGFYAGQQKLFHNIAANQTLIRKILMGGLLIGIVCNGLYIFYAHPTQYGAIEPNRLPQAWQEFARRGLWNLGGPAFCLFYITTITLLYQKKRWQQWLAPLAPVGRMALTNYLMHSLIAALLFYSYGLAFYDEVSITTGFILALIIFSLQVRFSAWWLEHYRFGPLEWVWRSLSYGYPQSMSLQDNAEPPPPHLVKRNLALIALATILLLTFGTWQWWQTMSTTQQSQFMGNVPGFGPTATATRPPRPRPTTPSFTVATPNVQAVNRTPSQAVAKGNMWQLMLAFDSELAFDEVETLTAPPYFGRHAGSPGGKAAAEYIAQRFAEYGLQPAGENDTYFQTFPIAYTYLSNTPTLTVNGADGSVHTYQSRQDYSPMLVRYMGAGQAEGNVVWTNDCAHNDFNTIDVSNKIVFCRDRLWYSRQGDAARLALEHGAIGLLLFGDIESRPVDRIGANREAWVPNPIPTLRVGNTVAEGLLLGSGLTVDDLSIAFASFPLSTTVQLAVSTGLNETAQARNVLGVLPGRDPNYAHEVIILGGHYDHMGQDPDGTTWYGANDNASGIAVLLEIARSWQEQGFVPRRTVLFAAWDAEEMGLLGAYHYVAEPRYPLTETIAMLQLDMVGGGEDTLYIDGDGPLVPKMTTIAHTLGISIANQHIGRSDHVPFIEQGIPANMLIWFNPANNSPATAHYHRPEDTIAVIEIEKLRDVGRLSAMTLLSLSEVELDILDLINHKKNALNKNDLTAFLQNTNPAHRHLNEQWFTKLQAINPTEINLTLNNLLFNGQIATATLSLNVTYTQTKQTQAPKLETRSATWPIRFIYNDTNNTTSTRSNWQWDGIALAWYPQATGFNIAYPPNTQQQAKQIEQFVNQRYSELMNKLNLSPQTDLALFLYHNTQTLRADSDLSLAANTQFLISPGTPTNPNGYTLKLTYTPNLTRTQRLTDSLIELALTQAGLNSQNAPWLSKGLPLLLTAEKEPLLTQQTYVPQLYKILLGDNDEDFSNTEAFLWAATNALQQKIGWQGIGNLAQKDLSFNQALQNAIGMDEATFHITWQNEWRNRLQTAQNNLDNLLQSRQEAVLNNDEAAFLATVTQNNPTLQKEQANWYRIFELPLITDFNASGQPLAFLNNGNLLADVLITYTLQDLEKPDKSINKATRFTVLLKQEGENNTPYRWGGLPYLSKQSQHFSLYYLPQQAALVPELLNIAENAYTQIINDLGFETTKNTNNHFIIKLYNNQESFQTSISLIPFPQLTHWTSTDEAIKLLILPQQSINNHGQSIARLLTRQLFLQQGITPTWFTEGLGIYQATQVNGIDGDLINSNYLSNIIEAVKKDKLLELADLSSLIANSSQQADLMAAQQWDMVRYLINTHGLDNVQQVIKKLNEGQAWPSVFKNTFNQSLADFETAWRASVARGHAAPGWTTIAEQFNPALATIHINALSHPAYTGRQPGSRSAKAAAAYIAQQFATTGLLAAGDDNSFLQQVPITYPVLLSAPRLLVVDQNDEPQAALRYREDFLLLLDGAIGSGESTQTVMWVKGEEYGPIRLSGQIVLRRPTGPVDWEVEQAIAHGASGLILLGDRTDKNLLTKNLPSPSISIDTAKQEDNQHNSTIPVLELTEVGFDRLLALSKYTLSDLNTAPPVLPLDLRLQLTVPISQQQQLAPNVLAVLPGQNPNLSHQIIILSTHYDHVGDDPDDEICLADGSCVLWPGLKYPGTNDDGSGVGILLEIARLWQETDYQPSRTILFAVWGSQELGQAGSQYFINHPTLPLTNTIAVYHLEGVGAGSGYYLQAQGDPTRESILRFTLDIAATQVEGRLDLVNSKRLSDQQPFQQARIPAILLYWKGAETRNLPAEFAREIDPKKLSTTGQILTLATMMLAE